ncbi:unnamed protein product [Bursaphelenchus xylophilus]|uniref:(pine wood nematode) hypothetical protein n=1 Tax=Bursaphelenchus xylophilus TaxID=6326 RepID=A0A1I7SW90_BURXY|nr:unnamed protein product [Bursaphelenchus xylophilus]CAG9099017.1 unnamed protein product [Bursaphelenchus xylophilus]
MPGKTRKPKVFNTLKLDEPNRGRVNVDLHEEIQEPLQNVVSFVQERYPGFFECPEKCEKYEFEIGSQEDGFPPVLDLSAYFRGDEPRKPFPGKSIFLTEYERLNGEIKDEAIDSNIPEQKEDYNDIEAENWKKIKAMDDYEIEKARQEIYERLSKESIDFLKNRAKENKLNKVSLFKQQRQGLAKKETPGTSKKLEEHLVKNLEVISDKMEDNPDTMESLERLAMDPIHMDFASKYMKSVLPRQEQNMVLLFEKLKVPNKNYDGNDKLVNKARENLDEISNLFLEEL